MAVTHLDAAPSPGGDVDLPPEAFAVALAELPGMGPARLRAQLQRQPNPLAVWEDVTARRTGADPSLSNRWAEAARERVRPAASWARCCRAGVDVSVLGGPGYPTVLAAGDGSPPVLFSRGDLHVLDGPRVAVVGARHCTPAARESAFALCRVLAEAGVAVVSGLGEGVDGAAHRGVLAARASGPVGVAAGGPDVVYPPQHRDLWAKVARAGVILSAAPPGARPERWRFRDRNRILAAIARVVLVIDPEPSGGSRYIADTALDLGLPVLVVETPDVTSSDVAALVASGARPARGLDDILAALETRRVRPAVAHVLDVDDATTGFRAGRSE